MTKKKFHYKLIIVVFLSLNLFIFCENKTDELANFKFEKLAESKPLFDLGIVTVSDIAVDPQGNVFLLNWSQSKIAKLDKDLRFKTIFGSKGQGPGEFIHGYSISADKEGHVYIHDSPHKIIRYSGDGKLIDETRLSGIITGFSGLVLNYPVFVMHKREDAGIYIKAFVVDISNKKTLGEYEMLQTPNPGLVNSQGLFISITIPFLGGQFFVDVYDKYCVIGEGERFFVRLLDSSGKQLLDISKRMVPQKLSAKEADFLANFLYETFPAGHFSKKDLRDLVGKYKEKNFIHDIKISKDRIYIFPVPDDITITKQHYPVEIYNFKGKLIMKGYFPKLPKKIFNDCAYFIETSQEDDEEINKLVKYKFSYFAN